MAVTRPFLKGMGLTDEQVSAIIEAHTDTIEGLKADRDKYKSEASTLAEVQKELDEYKNGEDWHKKYNDLDKTFKDYKTEVASREKSEKIKAAYTKLLKDSNIDDKRIDAILRVTDMANMAIGEDGNLVDADKLSEGIKNEWSAFIKATGTKGVNVETPPNTHNTTTMSKADVYAKDEHGRYKLSTSERQKIIMEHPEIMKGE